MGVIPALGVHCNLLKVAGSCWGDEARLVAQGEVRCYPENHLISWGHKRGVEQGFRTVTLAMELGESRWARHKR